jgi:two-component sensor histidine kinase/PAS domain-containing protein
MGKTDKERKSFKLRKKAEKIFENDYDVKYHHKDVDEIIRELRIHQIELEIQNEELRETQYNYEDSRIKYFDLYNLAPVGYFTLNEKGLIIDANIVGASMLEIDFKDLFKTAFVLFISPDYKNRFYHLLQDLMEIGDIKTAELEMITNEGNNFYAHLESILNVGDLDNGLKIAIFDVSDRKNAERQLKKSLEEKEVLIREIHHRVKNNLQIIASLLHLQETCVDGEKLDVLKESELRVKSMAIIHEKIYQSPTLTDINIKDYIETLVYDILYTYGIHKETIQTNLNISDINLNIDTAIPLGLIINELVTNSVKYAFPESKGIITIELKSNKEEMELTITDDGKGLPNDINLDNSDTLGLQLVNNLTNQIDGKIEIDRNHGTQFKINFKGIKYKKRT